MANKRTKAKKPKQSNQSAGKKGGAMEFSEAAGSQQQPAKKKK